MNVNFLLYDDFDLTSLTGPASVFGKLPGEFHLNYLSVSGDIMNSTQGLKVWTEPLVPEETDGIFVLPGGRGARRLIHHDEKYIAALKRCISRADACLMVGNASGMLAQTGLLYHRNVACYSGDSNWKQMFTAAVNWIDDVGWAADGKFYSCKNALMSLDMTLGLVADIIDTGVAERIAAELEYAWELDENGFY
ncbi:MAG: DJ-1/PfpI family protein [Fusicatenibacter sp.]|nr:DJ-1/PfpI family protein [Fusicatenibacter sp.]